MRKLLIVLALLGTCSAAPPPRAWRPFQHPFSLLATVFPDTRTGGSGSTFTGGTLTSPLLEADGACTAPPYSFTNAPTTTGMTQSGGSLYLCAGTNSINFNNGASVSFSYSNNTGRVTQYGGLATVGYGIPVFRGTQSLTAQTAAIGATNLYASALAGLYRVCFNAATTTSGTGTTATVSVIWTDAGGAKTFTSATWALNAVDVTGQVNGCQVIRSAAAANIQISTAGTFGTSVYRLDATAEAVQ